MDIFWEDLKNKMISVSSIKNTFPWRRAREGGEGGGAEGCARARGVGGAHVRAAEDWRALVRWRFAWRAAPSGFPPKKKKKIYGNNIV